jgi:hypothetical protein
MNILFYGNCQLNAICITLNLNSDKFNIYNIPCCNTNITIEEFISIIGTCDLIITQPIGDNYRNIDYLSTSFVINNAKNTCKIIILDSCYFDFYYFDVEYKYFNNQILHNPVDYHHNYMIDCYHNNQSIEYYIENYVNNCDLKSSHELEIIAENSLNELNTRYNNNIKKYNGNNIYFIPTYEFIKNNYKNKLLFFSKNHPSKYLIQYISEKIVDFLQLENTINYHIDVLASEPRCLLYKCLQKNINFDLADHASWILGNTDIYKITEIYYETYKSINF